jgi:hypothetical protein
MYQEIAQLLMYGDLEQDSILYQLGALFGRFESGQYNRTELVRDINTQVKQQIMDLTTICGTTISPFSL